MINLASKSLLKKFSSNSRGLFLGLFSNPCTISDGVIQYHYTYELRNNENTKIKKDLIYADECYEIMGVVFEVFRNLGFGHRENFYQKALAKSFKDNKIKFKN